MEINRENLLLLIRSGLKRDSLSVLGLEKKAGVAQDTVRDFLRGKTQVLRADKLQKILGVLQPQGKVRIAGHVGAGAEILFSDGAEKDMVDCPPGCDPSDVVAVRVRGDAMLPIYHNDWIIYYSRHLDMPIPTISGGYQVPYTKAHSKKGERFSGFIGKPCVIGLAEGRTLLGTLKHSATKGSYDLINYNAADIHSIRPQWVAKIIFIKTE